MPGRSMRSQRWDDEDEYGDAGAYGDQDDAYYGDGSPDGGDQEEW